MTETNPPLQIIVGATSPIARAYAVECAAAGKPLLLAGRNLEEIELIAEDLRIRHRAPIAVERYDAALPGEGRRLALLLAGRRLGVVVAFHGIMGGRDADPQSRRAARNGGKTDGGHQKPVMLQ